VGTLLIGAPLDFLAHSICATSVSKMAKVGFVTACIKFDWTELRQPTRLKLPIYRQISRKRFSTSHFLQVVVGSLDTLTEQFGFP
jgi:hypothetical protein